MNDSKSEPFLGGVRTFDGRVTPSPSAPVAVAGGDAGTMREILVEIRAMKEHSQRVAWPAAVIFAARLVGFTLAMFWVGVALRLMGVITKITL